MNFMEAVKAITENKIVKRRGTKVIQFWSGTHNSISQDIEGYDRLRFNEARFNIDDFEATDWEVVEDKKTLEDIKEEIRTYMGMLATSINKLKVFAIIDKRAGERLI